MEISRNSVIKYLKYLISEAKRVIDIKKITGFLINFAIAQGLGVILFAALAVWLGYLAGFLIALVLSFIVYYSLFLLYAWKKKDIIGIEKIKQTLRKEPNPNSRLSRFLAYTSKKGKFLFYSLFLFYTWKKKNIKGIRKIKHAIKTVNNKIRFSKILAFVNKQSEFIFFALLSAKMGPFTCLLFIRDAHDYSKMNKKDWRIFIIAYIIASLTSIAFSIPAVLAYKNF